MVVLIYLEEVQCDQASSSLVDFLGNLEVVAAFSHPLEEEPTFGRPLEVEPPLVEVPFYLP